VDTKEGGNRKAGGKASGRGRGGGRGGTKRKTQTPSPKILRTPLQMNRQPHQSGDFKCSQKTNKQTNKTKKNINTSKSAAKVKRPGDGD
jgi:hypothetical protein